MEAIRNSFCTNILVVIDTEAIKLKYPEPCQDPENPTRIGSSNHYIICSGSRSIIHGQGTGSAAFEAIHGDNVIFRGLSIYENEDDAVIIYKISYRKASKVFSPFTTQIITREKAVIPDTNTKNGLPPVQTSINFTSMSTAVRKKGVQNVSIYFGLYILSADGESQILFGYYYFDVIIQVG